MEDNFYKDEFEQFLQEQADNHRMFASDSVWRNIYKRLHGDYTWPALTVAAFTFLAAIIAVSVYFSPGPNIFAINTAAAEKGLIAKNSTPLLNSLSDSHDEANAPWRYSNTKPAIQNSEELKKPLASAVIIKSELNNSSEKNTNPITYSASSKNSSFHSYESVTSIVDIKNERQEERVAHLDDNEKPKKAAEVVAPAPSETLTPEKEIEKVTVNEYLQQHPTDVAALTKNNNKLKNRFSYLIYITPSMSFRKLIEDPSPQQQNDGGPVAINYVADVNKIVRHAPGTGVESGVAFRYNLTKNLKITSGFQFNVRQYLIEAYVANTELATIALQTSNGVEPVTRSSIYSTSNGYSSTELSNRYYQVSVPVGFEWQILGSKKVALNVAASVQPTYTLNNNAYLISTNFKNYAESGGMLRNWNINTSIGAFLNFNSGKYKWQLGPQFRYQQLPTFTSQYPIKEHLMDYGVKIGVSKVIH